VACVFRISPCSRTLPRGKVLFSTKSTTSCTSSSSTLSCLFVVTSLCYLNRILRKVFANKEAWSARRWTAITLTAPQGHRDASGCYTHTFANAYVLVRSWHVVRQGNVVVPTAAWLRWWVDAPSRRSRWMHTAPPRPTGKLPIQRA
jgi:hypothetical protein